MGLLHHRLIWLVEVPNHVELSNLMNRATAIRYSLNALLTILAIVTIVIWQTADNEVYSKVSAAILFGTLFIRTFIGYRDDGKKKK